jgi:DNA-binding CsgD family transcriptional regulator
LGNNERLIVVSSKVSFDHAAQLIIDAAVDPTKWSLAMDTLAQYSRSTGAVIFPVKGRAPETPHSASLGEGLENYFRDGWHLRDERNRGLPLIARKGIFVDQDFATPHELATSDYYRGFLSRFGLNWSAVVGFSGAEDEWCLVFERGDKQGFFDQREQDDLVRFVGPLKQAAALARSLSYANAAGALDAYQLIGCASFLVDDLGRVVRHNQEAQELLGDGLDLKQGLLKCSNAADGLALANLIASQRSSISLAGATEQVAVVRRKTKRPLVFKAVRLTGPLGALFSANVILLVSDLEKRAAPTPIDTLVKSLGLTVTEASLVAKLAQDIPLMRAAELMNITFETARTHLKRILSKTQTRRQQELLMLVQRLRP